MEKWLDEKFKNAHKVFIFTFLGSLFVLEYFDITLINSETSNGFTILINIILPIVVAALTFFAVLSLHRLGKLRNDKFSSQEIRGQLGTVGKRSFSVYFSFILISLFSLSDKSQFFQVEFIVRLDRVIVAAMVAFLAYLLLSAGRSYLSNIKPKDN